MERFYMAIKKHTIITHTLHNDDIWFNQCGESQLINNECTPNEGSYHLGIQSSDSEIVYDKILRFIDENNADGLKNILKSHFIYPGYIHSFISNEYRSKEGYHREISEEYRYRFNIEALLVEHFDKFNTLVNILVKKDDLALLNTFISSLKETGLGKLLEWNSDEKKIIDVQLEKLQNYGEELLTLEGDEKLHIIGKNAIDHARFLRSIVQEKEIETDVTPITLFNILKFKLELIKQLHAKDSEFNKHKTLKSYAANLCIFLVTCGLAHFANYTSTGHVFFFRQTATEQKIAEAHAAIGLDPKDKIRFHETGPV